MSHAKPSQNGAVASPATTPVRANATSKKTPKKANESAEQMKIAKDIMREDHELLKKLADS